MFLMAFNTLVFSAEHFLRVFQSCSYFGITLQQITAGREDTNVCALLQGSHRNDSRPSAPQTQWTREESTGVKWCECGPFKL